MPYLRELCDEFDLLLFLDEVQTGIGRTGHLFAHQGADVNPDVIAIAKGLGGGFPVGACLASAKAAAGMTAGTHGSTFGGNPLAMSVACKVLDIIKEEGLLKKCVELGVELRTRITKCYQNYPNLVKEVRGAGLMVGIKAIVPAGDLVTAFRDHGLLTVPAGDNVVRLLPPLIIRSKSCRRGIGDDFWCVQGVNLMAQPKHFLELDQFSVAQLRTILDLSTDLKSRGNERRPLQAKTLAMIFEKPSTRTRVSFEVGMKQLGGEVIVLNANELQIGRGETIADTARVLSRYVDVIMLRTNEPKNSTSWQSMPPFLL